MYAEIVVNMPVEGTFHYHIPAELAGRLQPGHLVEVPFGPQKAQGIVLALSLHSPVETTRPVLSLLDREPVVSALQLEFAGWMSQRYLATLAECVRLFVPSGLSRRGDRLIIPVGDPSLIEAETENQARVLRLLAARGPLRSRQIARAMPRRGWESALIQLAHRGVIEREPVLDRPVLSGLKVRLAELAIRPDQVEAIIARHLEDTTLPVRQTAKAARRAAILRFLAERHAPVEAGPIYAAVQGSTLADLRALAEEDWIDLKEEETWRDPLKGISFVPDAPPRLTPDQVAAWDAIRESLDGPAPRRPILLHGVTGSGKTELYLRAVERVLEQGRSTIVMVPEIALTPQTVNRFGQRFPGRMGLIHSRLTPRERYDTWRRARSGQFDVVIGPRSALFAPLSNLGLIVIDECHDDSYKQSPPVARPYYHAIPTAIELARRFNGLVILGSATPDVITYAGAKLTDEAPFRLITLPGRIMGHRRAIELQSAHYHIQQSRYRHLPDDPDETVMIDLPPVQVVDMRQELRANNRSIFSRALTEALQITLERGEQAILFLNRRGTSTYVFCRECGHVLRCPQCEIPLTWHTEQAEKGILICHQCSHRAMHPKTCPACGSLHIRFFGGGTERVEQEVRAHFPLARPLRWDRDTTGGKDAHTALLRQFAGHQANVLIGTQMIAKGLDLPMVTLVGVISADTALHLPDYRSSERTFQLLTQVAGRAGRGLLGGSVILQTYAPEHYAIQAAARHDFEGFYREEFARRQIIGYPPFSRLLRIIVSTPTEQQAHDESERLRALLTGRIREDDLVNTSLIGPAPCFYPRRDGLYRWHLIVRGPDPSALIRDLPASEKFQIDVDPVSLL